MMEQRYCPSCDRMRPIYIASKGESAVGAVCCQQCSRILERK
jgi:hypothetical protein